MKVAIIAIAKNEQLYINEWLDYHFNLGFDNIIVCDNDDELILKEVINDDRVIIEDYTKIYDVQQRAYGEFVRQKYFRGGPNRNNVRCRTLRYFWETNKKTDEKLAYAEKIIAEYEGKCN